MRRGETSRERHNSTHFRGLLRVVVPLLAILFNVVAAQTHAHADSGHQLCDTRSSDPHLSANEPGGTPQQAVHCDICPLLTVAIEPEIVRLAERLSFNFLSGLIHRGHPDATTSPPAAHRSRAPPLFS